MRSGALVVFVLAAASLGACGTSSDLSRSFGVSRDAPTATSAAPMLPLSVPPTLSDRPLRPGALPITAASDDTGTGAVSTTHGSAGQQALLSAAGGGQSSPPDIREQIDQDTRVARASPEFVDYLMNWSPPAGSATLFQTAKKGWFSRLF